MQTLTRSELTAALAARQMLLDRQPLAPAEAIRRLTPLQGQDSPAPYFALAARLDHFARGDLQGAIGSRSVVKTTIMRLTLHLVAAAEYPAYAQLTRQARMRAWRKTYAHLDEAEVAAELGAWLEEPRTNDEIRELVGGYDGVADDPSTPVVFARTLLALVQFPQQDSGATAGGRASSSIRAPCPSPSRPQRSCCRATSRPSGRQAGGTSTPLPVRLLARWDQPLLAYADRERIIPLEVQPLKLTLSGDATLTVDGRLAASWRLQREGDAVKLTITPHVDIRRSARGEIRAEAERTARFAEPDARTFDIAGV